jgi:putative transposase
MASTGKRYSEEQIIAILKEADGSGNVGELIRRHGISAHTYYRWKSKFGGMEVSEARRLKQLEDENRRLKRIVADQTLNIQILKEALGRD